MGTDEHLFQSRVKCISLAISKYPQWRLVRHDRPNGAVSPGFAGLLDTHAGAVSRQLQATKLAV
jgi:hypothetical protein